jgi:hypothetical protein
MAYNTVGVVQQAIAISSQLNQLIQSYLCMPVIGGTGTANSLALANLTADATASYAGYVAGGVRIEPLSYRTEYAAEVSEQLVVNVNGGREYLTDNVAARPRSWRISGYIPGDLITDVLGMVGAVNGALTGIQGPNILSLAAGLGAIQSEVSALFMPSLNTKQRYLEWLFYSGQPFQFKTRENAIIPNAVMSQLYIEKKAESQNKLNIEVVIHEINMLSINVNNISGALPAGGFEGSTDPLACGSTSASAVASPTATSSIASGMAADKSPVAVAG